MEMTSSNIPVVLNECGKYPYISYMQLGYADNMYSMFSDSYLVRFFNLPAYYMPGTQKTYTIMPEITNNIQTSIKKRRSRDNNIALSNPTLNSDNIYRGSLYVDLQLRSEISDDRLEHYQIQMLNNNTRFANGMPPLDFEQMIYFAMKRQTAVLLDQLLFHTLAGAMPTQVAKQGYYNNGDKYDYEVLETKQNLEPLPLTQLISVDEDHYTDPKSRTDFEMNGYQLAGQGLTLAKLTAAAKLFSSNNIEGQLVCFIPKSSKYELMRHPHAVDRTKEYIEPNGGLEKDINGNTFKRPFAWMADDHDIMWLDNIMLVFIPDERFPQLASQKTYHMETVDGEIQGAFDKRLTEVNVPNNGYIQYAYMVKINSSNQYSALEQPTLEWGIYDRDVFVSQALSKVRIQGALDALERQGTVNGFVVRADRYNDSMMKMLSYSIKTRVQLARILDKNVVLIEINPAIYGSVLETEKGNLAAYAANKQNTALSDAAQALAAAAEAIQQQNSNNNQNQEHQGSNDDINTNNQGEEEQGDNP